MESDPPRAYAEHQPLVVLTSLQPLARVVIMQALDDIANGTWPEARAAYAWLTTETDAVTTWMALSGLRVSVSRFRRTPIAAMRRLRGSVLFAELRRAPRLAMRWQDVQDDWLHIRETKTGVGREIPVSARLRAVLDHTRVDPAGRPHPPDAYVFGNEFGEAADFPRKAWETAVLKAHGHTPQWDRGRGKLTAEAQAVYDRIDLHFHDLRHEAGSRLLEAGWPLHHVRDMLGHQDLATTNRYLNADRHNLRDSMRRSDEARKVCKPFANSTHDQPELSVGTEQNDRKYLIN